MWKEAQDKAFKKVSAKVSVPGFRPGKAPAPILREHTNPEAIFNEAIDSVYPEVLTAILQEEKLNIAARPSVSVTKLSGEELELVFDFILVPTAKLGEYKGLAAKKEAPSVSDKEVDDAIGKLLQQNASLAVVDRAAKLGDTIILDFDGYMADEKGALKAFDGGKAENFTLELGSHQFIPGFEEGCVGLKSGDKKDLVVKFPENYIHDLANKEATFKITIHEVKEKQIPALTDEAVKEIGIKDVNDVAALKEYEKKNILTDKLSKSEAAYYSAILDQIVANSTFVIDPSIIAGEAARMEDNLKKQIEQQGLTFEQWLEVTGSKEDDLKKTYLQQAEKNFKDYLAEEQIATLEKIEIADSDVDAEVKRLAEQYKMDEKEVRSVIEKNLDQWKNNIRQKKIHDAIVAFSK